MVLRLALFLLAGLVTHAQTSCVFTINPTSVNVAARGPSPDGSANGVIQIMASAGGCPRTAVSNADWITISFGQSGTGNGSTGYTVRANTTPIPRTGTIVVGAQTFTVNQAAAVCNFQVSASRTRFPAEGAAATLTIHTTCSWTVTPDSDWIVVGANASGTGNGTVPFRVNANPAAQERSGRISIGGQLVLIAQSPAGCSFALSPTAVTVAAETSSGSVAVNSPSGCAWTALSNVAWISITSGGSAPGPVNYTVATNRTPQARTGTITIGDATFTVRQDSSGCALQLSPASASFPSGAGQATIQVTTTCDWTAVSDSPWISVIFGGSGSGNGSITYAVAANTANLARNGTINVSGRAFAISQEAAACRYTINPLSVTVDSSGGAGTINVTASAADCAWDAVSNAGWIGIPAVTRTGTSGVVNYTVAPSPVGRTGTLTVAGLTFTVVQTEAGPQITAAGIVNAASFLTGALSPGEMITLFGVRVGPVAWAALELTADGLSLTKELAGTRVLFDDEAGAMVFASEGQVSVIVPYGVAGKASTRVQVEFEGRRSNVVPMAVAAASPAIFTIQASGTGPGAILNQDFTVNSAGNPAAAGSIIQIFATGEGETEPAGVDGRLALPATLARPKLPVRVFIGGVETEVVYAGAAPGLVAGVIQVNARVPAGTAAGNVEVAFQVGEVRSRVGVTVAVGAN
jgi:uncharacterized protein (TIGR03437 family)